MDFNGLLPGRTDRAFICGQTGSGKTTLVRALLAQRKYVVVLDGKGNLDWAGYALRRRFANLVGDKAHKLIWRPSHEELRDFDALDRFFEWIFRRGNTTLYVDEAYTVTRGDELPDFYHACLTRGREYGVEVWSGTQRPLRIPQVLMSEAEHSYLFRLKMLQDRAKVASMVDIRAEDLRALPKHQFFYAPQDGEVRGPMRLKL